MLPINPSPSYLIPNSPKDVQFEILRKTPSEDLRNLRATCTALQNDEELRDLQEYAQRAEALKFSIYISRETIPEAIEELVIYKNFLIEKSSDMNCSELRAMAKECQKILESEGRIIMDEMDQYDVLRLTGSFLTEEEKKQGTRTYMHYSTNKLKVDILELEIMIAESKFSPEDYEASLEAHKVSLNETLAHTFSIEQTIESQHLAEKTAALFCSQPKAIQVLLKERQRNDIRQKEEFMGKKVTQRYPPHFFDFI
ncbi:MAG: hypothetical protein K0R08_1908 [Solimicrobium sp.]|jgi:hypothetical protein|nr:hypothetical protein [Solimicrobium sp.]